MQDLEFTIEDGKLFMLQTRNGKRTAAAALQVAVDMVAEGMITKEEAVQRIDPGQLDQLLHPMLDTKAKYVVLTTGLNASPGAAVGQVVFDADTAEARGSAGDPVILVRWETNPDDIHGLIKAQGVITSHGGMTSHAAVVARGMGKPCIAGASDVQIDAAAGTFSVGDVVGQRGRLDHHGRHVGPGDRGQGGAGAAADQRELRRGAALGRRHPPAGRAHQRRHARGRAEGAGVRRRGHRPLPHRAHVHGRGAAAARARHDHGRDAARSGRSTSRSCCPSSATTSRASSAPWSACR